MEFKVGTALKREKEAEALLYFIFEDAHDLTKLDPDSKGYVEKVIKFAKIEGKLNEVKLLFPMNKKFKAICLVGLGKKGDYKPDNMRQSVASACKVMRQHEIGKFTVMLKSVPGDLSEGISQYIAEGAVLGTYEFTMKSDRSSLKKPLESITGVTDKKHVKAMIEGFERGKFISDAVNFARDLANTPADIITPEHFSKIAKDALKGMYKIKVDIIGKKRLEEIGMGGLLAVNRGSHIPPYMTIVEYNGGKKGEKPLVLVGKGITFDTGGIDIKSWREMHEMKFDMAGAGNILGAIKAMSGLKIKRNVVGLLLLTENMIAGNAQKAGDVITMYNGKKVEYINTDAEGRMLLADGFSYAEKYNPEAVIALSTLTGSCKIALGTYCAALLSPCDELKSRMITTGLKVEEPCWELPLMPQFDKMLESKIADIANIPLVNDAMTSIGGVFLKSFAPKNVPWAHLDICSTANGVKNVPYIPEEASGWGVRLLVQLADDWK